MTTGFESEPMIFRCPQCEKEFAHWAEVRRHKSEAAAQGNSRCANALILRLERNE